jgi:Zn-dependent peptidase ImmA (M78 family)/transcriptional regulator with XRE-family HTH domain
MASKSEAFLTPDLLRWARARAGVSAEQLAKAIGVKPETIMSWESGAARPTFRQAEKLAKRLYVPFAYLFLPARPTEEIPLPDFRTIKNDRLRPSPALIDLINDVLTKHLWYRELLQSEGSAELAFVASFSSADSIESVASNISDTLGIADGFRESCNSWEQFLTRLIERVQRQGILVMRSGTVAGNTHRTVSPEEFRGFAISDKIAPLIFVNAADFRAAQTFTVAHELSHIWLGDTGISNENLAEPDTSNREKHCDAIAAELLLPRAKFLERWKHFGGNVGQLAQYFRVSSLVILRRARDLDQMGQDEFWDRFESEKKRYKRRSQGGGDFYRTLLARNSTLFTEAVITAINEERELYRDAARLLNVKVSTIPAIADHLANPSSGN